jgi:hypothetical protein
LGKDEISPDISLGIMFTVLGRKSPDRGQEKTNDDKILQFYLDTRTCTQTSSMLGPIVVQSMSPVKMGLSDTNRICK